MTDTAPRRRMPYLLRLVLVLAGAGIAMVIGWKATHPATPPATTTNAASAASAAEATTAADAPPARGEIGEGVWLVGTDVQPGTYRSSGATDGYCMWSRHSSVDGGPLDAIIASDGSRAGQMLATIQAGDKLFRTRGCAPFQKVS